MLCDEPRDPSLGGGTPDIQILNQDACYSKSLEHDESKVKKETARPPPSIWTDGKNGRRKLCDEPRDPSLGGGTPTDGKNGRRMLCDEHR
jgi:hypothetical protein